MKFFHFALVAVFVGIASLSGAQQIKGQAARARDFAAKAYMAQHPDAKELPNRVLVRFDNRASQADKASARAAAKGLLIRSYKIVPGLELIDSPLGTAKAMEILKRNPHVISVEADHVAHIRNTPNDPLFGNLWGMNQASDIDVNAPEAWDIFTGDANFLIADFDTGINYYHPDLIDNVWTNPGEIAGNGIDDEGNGYIDDVHGYDFVNGDGDPADDHSHGSHTAGTIGARGNNAAGVTGVNWACKIVSIKTFDQFGSGSDADIIAGMEYLAQTGAKVSNHSWGGSDFSDGSAWPALYAACQALGNQGHLMVCAAGNNQNNNDNYAVNAPAGYPLDNILAVMAVDSAGNKASFSAYGLTSVDLGAPGVSVQSTVLGTGYSFFQGTSMATPHVTGGAALLWAYHPNLTMAEIKSRIVGHTKPLASLAGLCVSGGMLDLAQIIVNGTPTAAAGTDQTMEATGPLTSFTLDATGSTDPDKDGLNYEWFEGATSLGTSSTLGQSRGVGSFTFDVDVTDAHGATNTDQVGVTIQDTTNPQFGAVGNITVTGTSAAGAVVTFSSPVANDLVDGAITGTCAPASGSTFPYGQTTVNVSATDAHSNTGSTTFKVNVLYAWSGFLSPFPRQEFKKGSNIPIKFKQVAGVTATGKWATVNGSIIGPEHAIGAFTFANGIYQLNWKTPSTKGTYRIFATMNDNTTHSVDVVLK